MNYYKHTIKRIGDILEGNQYDYILYPFGERGAMAKGILNVIYGIQEKVIIDNGLCTKYQNIKGVEYFSSLDLENCRILITSDNIEIYEELREQLYAMVGREKCIELFPLPDVIEAKRNIPRAENKIEKEGIVLENPVYQPKKTKSNFYLPLLPNDVIQRIILLSDDYYDRQSLDKVCRFFEDGIIGKKILEGKGVILDIGANIGNHTLFFCNEYGARKVYCFEPVAKTFSILTENIRLNHLEERVSLNRFGLGEECEKRSIVDYNLMNIGGTRLRADADGDLEIRNLDELGIEEPIILMKIDVEEMETKVLKGGVALIKKNMPYIMIESFEDAFPETKDILCGLGYKYNQLGPVDWLFYPGSL